MKIPFSLLIAFSAIVSLSPSIADESQIYLKAGDTDAILEKEGQKCIVYGNTKNSSKSASGTSYVNFDGAEFYLVTFKSDLDGFEDGEPHEAFDGKRIAVEGVISIYKDRPQIKLTAPGQVRILEEDEVFPPLGEEKEEPKAAPAVAKEKAPEEPPAEEMPKKKPPVDAKKYFK